VTGVPPPPGTREDREALAGLSLAYASAVDHRDGDRLAALFVPEGELVVPSYPEDLAPVVTRAGTEALRRVPGGLGRFERTFHLVGNTSFSVAGDGATGEVQCIAHHLTAPRDPATPDAGETGRTDTGWTDTVWFIRYHDRYARGPAGWRFVRRVLHLQWVEHHPIDQVGPQPPGTG
jgi:hypothetical protein